MHKANHRPVVSALATAALALSLGVGCATTSSKTQIDPALVAGISPDLEAPISEQEKAVRTATEKKDQAVRSKADAQKQVQLAETDLNAAKADAQRFQMASDQAHKRYEEATTPSTQKDTSAQLQRSTAKIDSSLEAMGKADTALRDAQARVDAEQMKLDYLKSLVDYQDARIKVAQNDVDLANARLERARFGALKISNPDQVKAMKLNQAQFDAAVADRQADVAKANADVERARADATTKYRDWIARGEMLTSPEQDRASVPAPPKG